MIEKAALRLRCVERHYCSILVLLLASVSCCFADSANRQCFSLKDYRGLMISVLRSIGYDFEPSKSYFCADTAPAAYQCQCAQPTYCAPRVDPWGRDVGECVCCSGWLFAVAGAFGVVGVILAGLVLYKTFLRGKWWCDGFVPPIHVSLPKRGAPMVIPEGTPLQHNVFRGYRSQDFQNVGASQPQEVAPAPAAPRKVPRSVAQRIHSRSPTSSPEVSAQKLLELRRPPTCRLPPPTAPRTDGSPTEEVFARPIRRVVSREPE
jgi:hypothetical protein